MWLLYSELEDLKHQIYFSLFYSNIMALQISGSSYICSLNKLNIMIEAYKTVSTQLKPHNQIQENCNVQSAWQLSETHLAKTRQQKAILRPAVSSIFIIFPIFSLKERKWQPNTDYGFPLLIYFFFFILDQSGLSPQRLIHV